MKPYFILFCLLCSSYYFNCLFSQCNHPEDYQALRDIYISLGGPNWVNADQWHMNIDLNDPTPPPNLDMSNWEYLKTPSHSSSRACINGRIGSLHLEDFSNNRIKGDIPKSIEKLIGLEHFRIIGTGINMETLDNLSSLPSLNAIFVDYYEFPTQLPNLKIPQNLKILYFTNSKFEGSVPRSYSGVTQLCLYNNNLSGCLDESLRISSGCMYNNSFDYSVEDFKKNLVPSCQTPAFEIAYPLLRKLVLENCLDPSELANWPDKIVFQENANLPYGFDLRTWEGLIMNEAGFLLELNLSNLNLCGTLPEEMANISTLSSVDLSLNNFNGNIPKDWSSLSNLVYLDISNNQLTGCFDSSLRNLNSIQINNNSINNGNNFEVSWEQFRNKTSPSCQEIEDLENKAFIEIYPVLRDFVINNCLDPSGLNGWPNHNFFEIHVNLNGLSEIPNLNTWEGINYNWQNDQSSIILSEKSMCGSLPVSLVNLTSLHLLDISHNGMIGCFDRKLRGIKSNAITNGHINTGNKFESLWEDFVKYGSGHCDLTTCSSFVKVVKKEKSCASDVGNIKIFKNFLPNDVILTWLDQTQNHEFKRDGLQEGIYQFELLSKKNTCISDTQAVEIGYFNLQDLKFEVKIVDPDSCKKGDQLVKIDLENSEDVFIKWSNGRTGNILEGIEPGLIKYSISLNNLCDQDETLEGMVEVPAEAEPLKAHIKYDDLKCKSDNITGIYAEILGGNGNSTIAWSDGITTVEHPDIKYGNALYLIVHDEAGCTASDGIKYIENPEALGLIFRRGHVDNIEGNNGWIWLSSKGGIGKVEFHWNDGFVGSRRDHLIPGEYIITLVDEVGCSRTYHLEIRDERETLLSRSVKTNKNTMSSPNVRLYPNPTIGSIEIEFSNKTEITSIEIFSITGHKIADVNYNSNHIDLKAHKLASGIYILHINTLQGQFTKRVFLQ